MNLPAPYHTSEMVKQVNEMQQMIMDMRRGLGAAIEDLEAALNMVRQYQRILAMAELNDPCLVEARRLLTKYGMDHTRPKNTGQIFVDGFDITEHPDSIAGTAIEVEDLPPGDEPSQITEANVVEDDDSDLT